MRPFTLRARTGLLAFAVATTSWAQQPQAAPAPALAAGEETPRRYFQVTRTSSPIRVDGGSTTPDGRAPPWSTSL